MLTVVCEVFDSWYFNSCDKFSFKAVLQPNLKNYVNPNYENTFNP